MHVYTMILSLLLLLYAAECGWTLVHRAKPIPDKLEMAFVVFRHGSRAPEKHSLYPTSKNKAYWKSKERGLGRLTRLGIEQEYQLGSLLKAIYIDKGFITSQSQIELYSTDYPRTKTSARCVMAGMFPDQVPTQGFNENFVREIEKKFSPIIASDWLLPSSQTRPLCGAYLREFVKLVLSRIEEVYYKYKTHIDKAIQGSGIKIPKKTDGSIDKTKLLGKVANVADTLYIERDNNLPMPKWYSGILLLKLRECVDKLLHVALDSDKAKRLTGGLWANYVLDKFEKKMRGVQQQKKLWLFSAHDLTIAVMMNVFGLFQPSITKPVYSSALMVELYSYIDGFNKKHHYVKFRYRPYTGDNYLKELKYAECIPYGGRCYMEKLKEVMNKHKLRVDKAERLKTECKPAKG